MGGWVGVCVCMCMSVYVKPGLKDYFAPFYYKSIAHFFSEPRLSWKQILHVDWISGNWITEQTNYQCQKVFIINLAFSEIKQFPYTFPIL